MIRYKKHEFTFESKSLQTAMIRKTDDGWVGKAQVDANDRREVVLPDGSTVTTTCLLKGEFDMLAVNIFAFEDTWRFVFTKNSDLPTSNYKKYTEYQRQHLLATFVEVHWPPKPPFSEEPFTLMNEIIQNRYEMPFFPSEFSRTQESRNGFSWREPVSAICSSQAY